MGATTGSCVSGATYPSDLDGNNRNNYNPARTASICPANWHLPIGGDNNNINEFTYLNGMMAEDGGASSSTNLAHVANWNFTGPWRGVLSGTRRGDNNLFNGQGTDGNFWSSSYDPSLAFATALVVGPTTLRLGANADGFSRDWGNAVRCVIGS
jgi:uncharacterized protein (TIGR02145 family)